MNTNFSSPPLSSVVPPQNGVPGDEKIFLPNTDDRGFIDPNARNLVAEVSVPETRVFGKGNDVKVLAVDCGIKNNIIRMLVNKGAEVHVVPWDTPFSKQLDNYDGLFLSNGPGDPTKCDKTIEELRKVRLIFLK